MLNEVRELGFVLEKGGRRTALAVSFAAPHTGLRVHAIQPRGHGRKNAWPGCDGTRSKYRLMHRCRSLRKERAAGASCCKVLPVSQPGHLRCQLLWGKHAVVRSVAAATRRQPALLALCKHEQRRKQLHAEEEQERDG